VPQILRIDPLRGVEIDLAGDAAGEGRRIELGDGSDAAAAGFDRVEVAFPADAVGRKRADAGDDDSFSPHLGLH
jgi:hypothetical protein